MELRKVIDEIQMWPLESIVPYAHNPRIHPAKQITQIAESMLRFGAVQPVLIDPQGNLIVGHGRILAACQIGLKLYPAVVLDHLTETEIRELRLADNKIAENSHWDDPLLSAELAALLEAKVDMKSLGF